MPCIYLNGFFLVSRKYRPGSTTREWIAKPTITVTMYIPKLSNVADMFSIEANFAVIKLQMPIGEYLK